LGQGDPGACTPGKLRLGSTCVIILFFKEHGGKGFAMQNYKKLKGKGFTTSG
jgi:hypothetical protein